MSVDFSRFGQARQNYGLKEATAEAWGIPVKVNLRKAKWFVPNRADRRRMGITAARLAKGIRREAKS